MVTREELFALVREQVADVLGTSPDEIVASTDLLGEYEIDSLELMEVGSRLENHLGVRLDPSSMYGARTVDDVIGALHRQLEEVS